MKHFIIAIVVLLFAGAGAQAQSLAMLVDEADLILCGEMVERKCTGRYHLFSVDEVRLIKGVPAGGDFRVCLFTDRCCHKQLEDGARNLLFLKLLAGDVAGLNEDCPIYTVHFGELGNIPYGHEHEDALLDALEGYLDAEDLVDPDERAEAVAAIYQGALRSGFEPLLYGATMDVIATPAALAHIKPEDESLVLARFQAAKPASRLRHQLLLLLGDLTPPGFLAELVCLVRTSEGRYFLDPSAAMLAALGDDTTPGRLIRGFEELPELGRENVIYVLGRMKSGKAAEALETLVGEYVDDHSEALIDALLADRSDTAAGLLAFMALECADLDAALCALEALARIKTEAACAGLETISSSEGIDDTVQERAAALLATLSR
ncbi:MAG: hypothetical protein ACYTG7_17480 [Planctomycetota bacterium]